MIKKKKDVATCNEMTCMSGFFYLHVVHDELEEPSQGAAFFLYSRIHFFHRLGKILLNFTTTFFYLLLEEKEIKTSSKVLRNSKRRIN